MESPQSKSQQTAYWGMSTVLSNMDDIMEAEVLSAELAILRDAYYNLDPLVPDQVYDAKRERLRQLRPDDPEIIRIGAPPLKVSVWEKVRHEISMGSLEKVNTRDEFTTWAEGTGASLFLITHKIDGSSMELVYKAGKLLRCVTRGDGIIGEDVTMNIRQVPTVPKQLPIPIDVIVRGEIVMRKAIFNSLYAEQYANPRNTAAGKVRDKRGGGADCQNLEFIAYWLSMEDRPRTQFFMFKWLENHGFQVPTDIAAGSISNIELLFEQVKQRRADIPYEIDGMVVSVNDIAIMDGLGERNMRPRGQIAWKFDPVMAETQVEDVKWQVGPTGRVTPVATIVPIDVGGVTITNISLHNLSLFRDLKLFRGCHILVSRRNDCIPYCESNLDSTPDYTSGVTLTREYFAIPVSCPICGASTLTEGQFLYCRSKKCPVQLSGSVQVWVRRLGLLHWGDAVISSLTNSDHPAIMSLADLYRLKIEDLMEHCSGMKTARKLYQVLHDNKSVTLDLLIASMNIPNLATATAADIVAAGFNTVEKILGMTIEDLIKVPNIGVITAKQVYDGLQERRQAILDLASVVDIKLPQGSLAGKSFCITGATSKPRKAVEKMILDAGGSVKGSVSAGTTYLVTNDPDTGSNKLQNAQKHGTRIITETELYQLIN
jgi:DNA ligase (NAD+)